MDEHTTVPEQQGLHVLRDASHKEVDFSLAEGLVTGEAHGDGRITRVVSQKRLLQAKNVLCRTGLPAGSYQNIGLNIGLAQDWLLR